MLLTSVLGASPALFRNEDDSTNVEEAQARDISRDTFPYPRYLHIPTQLRIQAPWSRIPIQDLIGSVGWNQKARVLGMANRRSTRNITADAVRPCKYVAIARWCFLIQAIVTISAQGKRHLRLVHYLHCNLSWTIPSDCSTIQASMIHSFHKEKRPRALREGLDGCVKPCKRLEHPRATHGPSCSMVPRRARESALSNPV